MPNFQLLERPRQADYVYLIVMCICITSFGILSAVTAFYLQRQLEPSDSLLFGPTPIGGIMWAIPTTLFSLVPALILSTSIARRIRHALKMPAVDPPPDPPWAESINWRLVGTTLAVILIAVGGKGFGSYFYVTEQGLSVRPPLGFSLRHYDWDEVASVTIRCRPGGKGRRFSYVLSMSDGYDIDLSRAPAARFAEAFKAITTHLNSLSAVRYEFDMSEAALAALGRRHGGALALALRGQVLEHGGTLQK